MVYAAAGISGLTAVVGTFYVKERLGLSAEFLAGLAFWAMLPWALKMPLGHLVDLMWRMKSIFVYLGAGMIVITSYSIHYTKLYDGLRGTATTTSVGWRRNSGTRSPRCPMYPKSRSSAATRVK